MTRLLTRLLLGAALILMIGHLLVYVVYAVSLANFPFDYDQGEGFELNDTMLLSQGQWPYRPNEVYPFYASNYPPLYHVLLIPFAWLFGPQYWYGRLFGFAATLITAAAIGYAVYRETRRRIISVLAGLAFLASNYIYHVGPLFRQHMTMVMFETLAVVAIASYDAKGENDRRNLLIGMGFLLAAGFTKQLAIATVAAFFMFLFLRSPRRAIFYAFGFGIVAGAIFLLINLSTGGQWWLNIITANVNQYIVGQFLGLARQFFSLHGALFVLAVLYALYELYFSRLSAYTIWFVLAGVDALLAGKWGAGDSYFATLIAGMCILAGLFAGKILGVADSPSLNSGRGLGGGVEWLASTLSGHLDRGGRIKILSLTACTAFVLYGLAVVHLPLDGPIFAPLAQVLHLQSNTKFPNFYDSAGWTMGYATIGQLPTQQDVANGWRIVALAKADERPALSEEAAFSFHAGKPIVSNPTQLLNLYQNGHYEPSALVRMIQQQAFGVVIFRARFYPQPVLDAVDAAYQPAATIPMNGYDYSVLLPRPSR